MTQPQDPTHVLADHFAALRLEDVPAPTRAHAADLLLDAFVCALAADHAEDLAPFATMADAIGGPGSSTVIGSADRRAMASAVLLNGFRITAVTACDVFAPAEMHSTPAVVPPMLACAERERASGVAVLRAVVVGLETAVRLARSFDRDSFRARGWHSPGVVAPFGAAAAVASVLGLDAPRMRHSLAIAGSQAAGTWAARGSPTVKFHQARAAFAGMMSGLLAAHGFEGAAEIMGASEGGLYTAIGPGDPAAALDGLGDEWALEGISLRLWPGSARVQPAMAATIEARGGSPLPWEAVERVVIRVAPSIAKAQAWAAMPESTFAALASMHFTVALTIRYGLAPPARFANVEYSDPQTRAFVADRIEVVPDESVPTRGARVEIATIDGRTLTGAVDVPRGDPTSRATRAELSAKAHSFGDDRIGANAVDELIDRIRGIDSEPNLDRVLELVRGVAA